MSRQTVFLLVLFVILILTDLYAFKGVWTVSKTVDSPWRTTWRWGYWLPSLISFAGIAYVAVNFSALSENRDFKALYLVIGFTMAFFVPKLFFIAFHITDDVVHLFRWIGSKLNSAPTGEGQKISRLQFINQAGLAVSAVVFGGMVYGIFKGKFDFRFERKKVGFKNLPEGFDGARIVQISDAHLGSFLGEGKKEIARIFDRINDLNPDYIFFTGDMVNNYATEAKEWVEVFSRLKASGGKFAIFGNHDYGDYVDWPSRQAHRENLNRLKKFEEQMGFKMLLNENVTLRRNGDEISLLGVENWGHGFVQYGNLEKARQGISEDSFKILLSHDPTHWEEQVLDKESINLTFSGHTHGMQFGLELPTLGIKISPARLRYKRWGGLYKEGDQALYVNRGFGFLGFPGRVGMPPEVTVIELERITI